MNHSVLIYFYSGDEDREELRIEILLVRKCVSVPFRDKVEIM